VKDSFLSDPGQVLIRAFYKSSKRPLIVIPTGMTIFTKQKSPDEKFHPGFFAENDFI